jgi:hypothetical protein
VIFCGLALAMLKSFVEIGVLKSPIDSRRGSDRVLKKTFPKEDALPLLTLCYYA